MSEASEHPIRYQKGLERIRRVRRLCWGSVLAFLPTTVTASLFGEAIGKIVFAIFLIGLLLLALEDNGARCPRCRKAFFVKEAKWGFSFLNAFSNSCLNCGLSLKPNHESSGATEAEAPPDGKNAGNDRE